MAEGNPHRVGGLAVAVFRVTLWCHAALVAAQPISAGAMLQASVTGRALHEGVGGVLLLVAMAQVPVAVLAWRPGGWPAWPVVASTGLLVAETTQLTIGYSGELGLHLPLGVAIVAAAVAMACWSLRARGRPRTPGVPRRRRRVDTLVSPAPRSGEDPARP